jgi:squalene synthase HpnC
MKTDDTLDNAYQFCLQMAQQHYENFPTASRLLAKSQRRATAAIYAFARSADDIADEGNMTTAARHTQLDAFATRLSQIQQGKPATEPLFLALADTIRHYDLPIHPFEKLLHAFRLDIDTRRFPDFSALAAYCGNSANPVGELVLRLHNNWDEENARYSDAICTALQLINFIQDLDSDYRLRGRIYIPMDEMQAFGIDETYIAQRRQNQNIHKLIQFQLQRAQELLQVGQPLLARNHGRLRFMLKLTLSGAQRMIEKLQTRTDVYTRPTLHVGDLALIATRSLLFQPVTSTW